MERILILRVAFKLMSAMAVAVVVYVILMAVFGRHSDVNSPAMIRLDVSDIGVGEIKYFDVLNKQLLVLHRSSEMITAIEQINNKLKKDSDSDSMRKLFRSESEKYFVAYAHDPFYGCKIELSKSMLKPVCINLQYDLTGRPYNDVRDQEMLLVPEYKMETATSIIVNAN